MLTDRASRSVISLGVPMDVPSDYDMVYLQAYRRVIAGHPTELITPARPGKRAREKSPRQRALEKMVTKVITFTQNRLILRSAGVVVLLVAAYLLGLALRG